MKTKQINLIKLMNHLGFKKYQAGKEVYFLPIAGKIKPMSKIKLDSLLNVISEPKPETPKKIKTVKKKSKKGGKK